MDTEQARAQLNSLISDSNALLLSPKEVSSRLDTLGSEIFAGKLVVLVNQLDQQYRWGSLDSAPPVQILRKGSLSSEVKFEVRGDRYPETSQEQDLLPLFQDLAEGLWGNDMRPMGGASWKRESVRTRLVPSVERLRGETDNSASIAVLYADLDNFKALNDQAGHEKGDAAIRLVNRELHDLCLRHGGLAFHPSGDEFYIILPNTGLLPMMEALYQLRRQINSHEFHDDSGEGHKVDLTLGLEFLSSPTSVDQLQAGLIRAEAATKEAGVADSLQSPSAVQPPPNAKVDSQKQKRRGRLSIAGAAAAGATQMDTAIFGKLASVMVRRRTFTFPATFVDPRLGLVQKAVRSGGLDDTASERATRLRDIEKWLDISQSSACFEESILVETAPKSVPRLALAMAVASGLLQAYSDKHRQFPDDLRVLTNATGSEVQIILNGAVAWGDSFQASEAVEFDLVPAKGRKGSALIAVQVGFQEHLAFSGGSLLPHDLFSQVVVVDDRPNSGGGLPDFWQAAVAQVCQAAVRGDGEANVFAWGKTSEDSETVKRLKGRTLWSEDEIAQIAGISSLQVRELAPKLQQNTVIVVDTNSVVEKLYAIAPILLAQRDAAAAQRDSMSEALQREMLRLQVLHPTDGIRCKSAAQAYPQVIDILRKAATRPSADDARRPLRELLAFKLVLETPGQLSVPGYLRRQEDDMKRYTNQVLLDSAGRIRVGMESHGQVTAFKKEIQACYQSGSAPRSTRRAVLVVPHEPPAGQLPLPQGLVCAWASPNLREDAQHVVDYVFVWRTVEAFIGLPYSLYGSIQVAQSLLSQINAEAGYESDKSLRLGELTYIALSLHMRSDGVHPRIAKRIVDESSE